MMRWTMLLCLILVSARIAIAEDAVLGDISVVGKNCQIHWNTPVYPDGSIPPDIKDYRVYVTTTKGVYNFTRPNKVVQKAQTTCREINVTEDALYYVVVTMMNKRGDESVASIEASFLRDTRTPPEPTMIQIERFP